MDGGGDDQPKMGSEIGREGKMGKYEDLTSTITTRSARHQGACEQNAHFDVKTQTIAHFCKIQAR